MKDLILESHDLPTGTYGFSATKIEDLGATEYTLVTIVVDVSGSVSSFEKDMESAIKEIVNACKLSPRADNLMIRFVTFSDNMKEEHGFKLLSDCDVSDYDNCLYAGGVTSLFDAVENSIKATSTYASTLVNSDFDVNGIVAIITDGCDNSSHLSSSNVKEALTSALHEEALESLITILIGVGIDDNYVGDQLDEFKQDAGLTQYVEVKNANAKTIAKIADFISKSISAQSNALNSGGGSQPLQF